ncbi:MAG: hypothetical protein HY245_14995 [Rhizobiales bacterium]|nr:hypothetical protein [Hyphomicrobiales bacterium]MBI3674695.1 hypothetical protein [Hyphomicrobiales bacterium]
MTIQFDYGILDAFNARSPSMDERQQIFDLWCEIANLDQYVRKFDHILKLYRFARDESRIRIAAANERRNEIAGVGRDAPEASELLAQCRILEKDAMMYRSWTHIAARDGAMTIYHLCHRMMTIWSKMQCCSLFDASKVGVTKELAERQFARAFPAFVTIRNSMTGLADNAAPPLHVDCCPIETAYFKSDVGLSLFFGGSLEGDTFQVAFDTHIHGYDLYEESLYALQELLNLIRKSFIDDKK